MSIGVNLVQAATLLSHLGVASPTFLEDTVSWKASYLSGSQHLSSAFPAMIPELQVVL